MKLCIDCRYLDGFTAVHRDHKQCHHPKMANPGTIHPVTGQLEGAGPVKAVVGREQGAACGPEAQLFEAWTAKATDRVTA